MRFISDISVWWLLPWMLVSFFTTFFLYKNEPWFQEIKKSWRYCLKALRFSSIFLIGILLIGLLFEAISYRIEKPYFITLVDNSSSMLNYKDSSVIKSKIESFQASMKETYGDKFDFIQYTVGSKVIENGKIDFKESNSALSDGFESIYSNFYNRNIGGIAFFSDGNFNKGVNPIYSADKINLTPIFTIGVGDTIPKKDQYIKEVESNEIAFLHNKFPVEVDIEAIKVGKSNATVSITQNGNTIASQSVNFLDGKYDYKHISFLLEANKVGHQQYTVSISHKDGEFSRKNNSRSFYIEVLDARSKILLLTAAPHPDISALKSVIEKDENVEVISELTKDWNINVEKIDLIIWHEPGILYDEEILKRIQSAKIPILYFIGPNTNNSIIKKLPIGMTINSSGQLDEIQAKLNTDFQNFEVSSELQTALNFFPPLKSKFGEIKLNSSNEVFLYQRIGSIQKKDPLLFFGSQNNVKYGVVYGEGIWKWKMNEYVRLGDQRNFNELIQKITQYLIIKQNASSLRVSTPKIFSKDDEILIKAEFYNSSLELITTPTIDFILKNEKNKVSKHQFGVVNNFYKMSLGNLKPGKYSWVASCKYNGKTFSKSGVFVVEDLLIETLDSYSNHNLLNQISANSNGKFYNLKNVNQLIDDIQNRNDIVEMSYKETAFNDLIDYKILFVLLILLLTVEWFLRRWFGAY